MKIKIYALFIAVFSFTGLRAQTPCSGTPNTGTIEAADTLLCLGDSVHLMLTGLTETGLMFQWQSSPDGVTYTSIGGAIDSTYSDTISGTTWYRCVVTCVSSGISEPSGALQVQVATSPPSGGSISATNTGSSYLFSVDGLSGSYTYAWDFGDGGTSDMENPSHSYTGAGSYTVTVIVANGCGSDTLTYSLAVSGVNEWSNDPFAAVVYPNPATDRFSLQVGQAYAIEQVSIIDISGRVCWSQGAPFVWPLSLSAKTDLPGAGIYLVELGSADTRIYLRMVVE